MTSLFGRTLALAAITFAGAAASAQESTNRVATMTDWNVFTEESPKECWGVSKPKETVNSRDGKAADAVKALTDGKGVDTAIEAVGIPATFALCEELVAPGGGSLRTDGSAPPLLQE